MRRLLTIPLAPALPALLAMTVLAAACGDGGDDAAATEAPATTETTVTTEAPATTETTNNTDTTPPAGSCEEAAVRQAIANSDAIAPSLTFEFTHLKCAEGFGWAMISADIGETATVLFKVSGTDVELLNLGTSVCATDAGIPADVAAQLAPPGRPPLGDCP
jgi:hypothetical protein